MSFRELIKDLRTAPLKRRKALCDELAKQYQLTLKLRFQQRKEIKAYRDRVAALEGKIADILRRRRGP